MEVHGRTTAQGLGAAGLLLGGGLAGVVVGAVLSPVRVSVVLAPVLVRVVVDDLVPRSSHPPNRTGRARAAAVQAIIIQRFLEMLLENGPGERWGHCRTARSTGLFGMRLTSP